MGEGILEKIEEQNEKLEKIWKSVEKTRKYFLWTLIIALVTFVLPLVILLAIFPKILSLYTGDLNF